MVRVHGCLFFAILLVYLSIPKSVKSSVTSRPDGDIAREILLKQPDFVATEIVSSAHSGHGFSIAFEKAKKGDCYRVASDLAIVFTCLGKPDVTFYPNSKEYREERRDRNPWTNSVSDVQVFANEQQVKFKIVGIQKIGKFDCVKIQAKKPIGPNEEQEEVYFYAAKDLRNLVIGIDVISSDRRTVYRLEDVKFKVPGKLFKRPVGYSKERTERIKN
jgi:hypothetical protein